MQRREFITLVEGAAAVRPFAAGTNKRPLIVWLGSEVQANADRFVGALREGLEELGYVEGRNIELIGRFAENKMERLPSLVEEVVALKPEVIAAGAFDAALAAKKVTSTSPIVSGTLADAEHLGLVVSYSHPGGNVTDPKVVPQLVEVKDAARALGLTAVVPEINGSEDVGGAIQALANERVDVVIVLESTMLFSLRRQIAQLMAANRLPAVYGYRDHVDEGGLISYGVDLRWCWRRAATSYAHRILNGAAPADLPVEFPTKIPTVVNLKAAKELGLMISPTLVSRGRGDRMTTATSGFDTFETCRLIERCPLFMGNSEDICSHCGLSLTAACASPQGGADDFS